jgi:hypothetical protein
MGMIQYYEAKMRRPTPSSTSISLGSEDLSIMYNEPLSVAIEKKAILLDMWKYLPNEYHDLYRFLSTDD